jgi:probable nitrogen fixation protein
VTAIQIAALVEEQAQIFHLSSVHKRYLIMTATLAPAAAPAESDPVLGTDFAIEMVRQMRAVDAYGTYDAWPAERILEPFILTQEKKREIPVIGDPDEIILSRVKVFYNAIAALIEKECGLMAVPTINLTHEGFGRALITVGKLVVMDRTLRDVHRFGFPSLSKMKDEADKVLSVALELIGAHSKVAGL